MLKGFILETPFHFLLMIVIITVALLLVTSGYKQLITYRPSTDQIIDVRYACFQYNETEVNLEQLKTLFYGFLTDQCNSSVVILKEALSISDIEKIVKEIDRNILVIRKSDCNFPSFNTHSVYAYSAADMILQRKTINMVKRNLYKGDVLICEV